MKLIFLEILKSRRIELGISQQELAESVGFRSKTSIHWFEMGKREWRLDNLIKACEFLDLKIKIERIK